MVQAIFERPRRHGAKSGWGRRECQISGGELARRGNAGTGTCPPTVVGGVVGEGAAWECGHRDVPAHLGQVL